MAVLVEFQSSLPSSRHRERQIRSAGARYLERFFYQLVLTSDPTGSYTHRLSFVCLRPVPSEHPPRLERCAQKSVGEECSFLSIRPRPRLHGPETGNLEKRSLSASVMKNVCVAELGEAKLDATTHNILMIMLAALCLFWCSQRAFSSFFGAASPVTRPSEKGVRVNMTICIPFQTLAREQRNKEQAIGILSFFF